MYFSIVVAFAILPFLVRAVPVFPKLSRAASGRPFSIPLTKRSNHLDHEGFIDTEQMHAGLRYSAARFDRALIAYERNTGEPHPLALKQGHRNERRIITSQPLALDRIRLLVWVVDIAVGTPARPFSVAIDTTTPDVYLDAPSSNCSSFCNFDGVNNTPIKPESFYNISLSSTGKNLSSQATADYAFGTVFGDVVSDSVSVEGFGVPNQKIILAKDIDPLYRFPDVKRAGALGMGFEATSALKQDSWFSVLIASGGLEFGDPKFALIFDNRTGELIIGGTDQSKFLGDLTYINVDIKGFWQIHLDSISVNGDDIVTNKEAILDTDNPFITGDTQTITNIYNNIPGSTLLQDFNGLWRVPCDAGVNIDMTFNGTVFTIQPSVYVIKTRDNTTGTPDGCFGAFAIHDAPNMLLGTAFMKNLYTEFDQEHSRIGFARRQIG